MKKSIAIRVETVDWERWCIAAKGERLSFSEWMRRKLNAAIGQKVEEAKPVMTKRGPVRMCEHGREANTYCWMCKGAAKV